MGTTKTGISRCKGKILWKRVFPMAFVSLFLVLALAVSIPDSAGAASTTGSSTIGHSIAGSKSLTLDRPADTAPGDFLLACIAAQTGTTPVTLSAPGWSLIRHTQVRQSPNSLPANFDMFMYYKLSGPSEPDSYTFSYTSTETPFGMNGGITRYSGIWISNPIEEGSSIENQGTGTTASGSAVDVYQSYEKLITFFAASEGVIDFSVPAGTSQIYESEPAASSGYTWPKIAMDDRLTPLILSSYNHMPAMTSNLTLADGLSEVAWGSQTIAVKGCPTMTIGESSSIAEEWSEYIIPLNLDFYHGTYGASVNYAVTGGTALYGVDYTLQAGSSTGSSGTITFPARSTTYSGFKLKPINDYLHEGNKSIEITFSDPTYAILGINPTVRTFTLNDNDPDNYLYIDAEAITEGDSGTTNVTLHVSLQNQNTSQVIVHYAAADGTAVSGGPTPDYMPTSGDLVFPPGPAWATQTITVTVNSDNLYEPMEYFWVNLSSPAGASFNYYYPGGVRIDDNDSSKKPVINEFVADHVGDDTNEYIEISGYPDTDYSDYRILCVENDLPNPGFIDRVYTPGSTNSQGIWRTPFLHNELEDGSFVLMLVQGFTGAVGQDIDADNDQVPDGGPWNMELAVVDGVEVFNPAPSKPGDLFYAYPYIFDAGGASRIPNATGEWMKNDFDGVGLPGFQGTPVNGEAFNTPGAINSYIHSSYYVSFDLGTRGTRASGGELQQWVAPGSSAAAPVVTPSPGWVFVGWNRAFDFVISNFTVNAVYSEAVFFSEYVEGSGSNKALEIYNGSNTSIDLDASGAWYNLEVFFNGSTSPGLTIDLTGTIAPGDVYVIAPPSASADILARTDQIDYSGIDWFDGDDTIVLRKYHTVVDVIGQTGYDPGTEWGTGITSTADNTLRRKAIITYGDINGSDAFDPSVEWEGFAADTFNDLGVSLNNIPIVGFTLNSANDNESITPINVPTLLSAASTETVTVDYAVTGAAAGGGIDYTLNNGTLTFAAGVTSQNISIEVVNDVLAEDAETIIITLSNPINAVLGVQTIFTYTINDNDSPGITASPTSGLVTSEEGGQASFTIGLNTKPENDVTVYLNSSDTGEGTVSPSPVIFTVINNETKIFSPANNGDSNGNWTTSDPALSAFECVDDHPANDEDYITSPHGLSDLISSYLFGFQPFNVPPEATDISLTVYFRARDISEGINHIHAGISLNNDRRYSNYKADNLLNPRVSWGEAQSTWAFNPATKSPAYPDGSPWTVDQINGIGIGGLAQFGVFCDDMYSAIDVSAVWADVSYNVPGNWNVLQTITVTGVDDAGVDGSIDYSIEATADGDYYYNGKTATVGVMNIDNDSEPVLTINDVSVSEGDSGTVNADFTVSLSAASASNVTVYFTTVEGTAAAGSDYTGNSGILIFAPDEPLSQTVTILVNSDTAEEGNETFSVHLYNPSHATIGDGVGTGIILDDDEVAGLTVSSISGHTTEAGGTAYFEVVLNTQPSADVTIGLSSSDPGEGTILGDLANLTFTPADWSAPQQVVAVGVDDVMEDGDVTYSIIIGSSSSGDSAYNNLNPPDVSITNNDNDIAGFTVSSISGHTTEAGGTAYFEVVLNTQPVADVIIGLSSSDPGEGTLLGDLASLTFTPADWSAPQQVVVVGADDALVDGDVTYSIIIGPSSSADPAFNNLDPPDVSVTNSDNDIAGFTVSSISGHTTEAGGTAYFEVVLNTQPFADVIIGLSSSDPVEGTLLGDLASLTFTPADWSAPQQVVVVGADDALADGDVTYSIIIGLSSSSDPAFNNLNPPDVSVTNNDNEAPPTLTISDVTVTEGNSGTTNAIFNVMLSAASEQNVTVAYASADGSAEAGSDYIAASGTLTFTPGETGKTITVQVNGDSGVESDETFSVNLSNASGATISDDQGLGTITDDDTATKVDPTLSATNSPVTYNGSPQSATVGASYSGSLVEGTISDIKYNTFSTIPTEAGTYVVTADFTPYDTTTYNSLNDAPAGNFVIGQATSTTVVAVTGGESFTYDGNAHPATVSVTGAGGLNLTPALDYSAGHAPINVTDSGSTASYTYAGDVNHTGSSDSKTYAISKADADFSSIAGWSGTYDGVAHGATGSVIGVKGETLAGLDLGLSYTDVPGGTANWTFSDVTGNYNNANGDVAITIGQATSTTVVAVTGGESFTYDGNAHPATVSVTGAGGLNLTPALDYSAGHAPINVTDSGSTASYTYAGDVNHTGSSDSKTYAISKADADFSSIAGWSGTYDGVAHGATGSVIGVKGETLAGLDLGLSYTDVPGGTANWTFSDITGNYNNANGDVAITIGQATSTTVVAVTGGESFTYDGNAHPATVSVTGAGGLNLTPALDYSAGHAPINVTDSGSTASYTYAGDVNHTGSSDSKTYAISKADADFSSIAGWSGTYDGVAHGATGSVIGVKGETLAGLDLGLSYTDVPGGTANWTFSDVTGNYNNANGDVAITIGQATSTTVVAVTGGESFTYDGNAHPATVSVTGAGGLNLTPALDYSAGHAPINVTDSGSTASYTYAGDVNHTGSSDSKTYAISKADADFSSIAGWSGTYDGVAHGATGSVIGVKGETLAGLDLGLSYTDVPGGTANWTFSDITGNYNNANGDVAITIGQATSTTVVAVTGGESFTYDGNAHPATVSVTGAGGLNLTPALDYSAGHAPINVTDSGSTASYTYAGDVNHTGSSDSKTYAISKADADFSSIAGWSGTYDGVAHGATGSVIGVKGETLAGLDLGLSYTDVPGGTANWTFSDITGNYNNANGDVAITIGQATSTTVVAVTGGESFTYDGNAHPATVSVTGAGGLNLTPALDYSAGHAPINVTDSGSTASYTYAGDVNHTGSSDSKTYAISKADADFSSIAGWSGTYDGVAHGATGSVIGVKGETLAGLDLGLSYTDVPGGTANWTFSDITGNYNNANGDVAITIGQATSTTVVAVTGGESFTYDGNAHPATVSVTGAGGLNLTPALDYSAGHAPINVTDSGSTASYTYAGDVNHTGSSDSKTYAISKADADFSSIAGWSGTYDGVAHGATGSVIGVKGETLAGLDLGLSYTDVPGGVADWVFTDVTGNYNDDSGSVNIVINKAELIVTAEDKTSDYGDPMESLTYTMTGFIAPDDKSSVVSGSVSLSTVPANLQFEDPDDYPITVDVSGLSATNYYFTPVNDIYTINPENGELTFDPNNPVAVQVAAPGGEAPIFQIIVQVIEDNDGYPGGLEGVLPSEFTLSFKPVGGGSGPAPIHATEFVVVDGVGIATFNVPAGMIVEVFTMTASILNEYYVADTIEDVLVVFDPSLGFATGGGWFYWPSADDRYPELAGAKTNFGFTMKYNKKGQQLQGSLLLIAHLPDGSIYRIKSNVLDGLALSPISNPIGWATFSGKCTYVGPDLLDNKGGLTFMVRVEDGNNPGAGVDKFWFTVVGMDFSLDIGTGTGSVADNNVAESDEMVTLNGGNIVVPHTPANTTPSLSFITGLTSDGSPLDGTLATGFTIPTIGTTGMHVLALDNPVATPALADGEYAFTLKATKAQKTALTDYFAAKGWSPTMLTQISAEINGTSPFFYIQAAGGTNTLVDGFKQALGISPATLGIDDDYPVGSYVYNGTLTGSNGSILAVKVTLNVVRAAP